jgi:chromate transport protein ChrA
MVLIKIYRKVRSNRYVVSFFDGVKSAVVAILLSTGIVFITMNWLDISYAIFGIGALLVLVFLRIEPIFLIVAGAIFGLVIG